MVELNKVLSLIIYSDFGFFKKPDVNRESYLTYEFIPKPAILGILGAIAGFSGYNDKRENPQYYEKLNGLKVGVQPLNLKPIATPPYLSKDFEPRKEPCQKTFVTYCNYHGYGSYEEGGNLIVREQILIRPSYRIFVNQGTCNAKDYELIKERLSDMISHYTPYMGKNDFPLSIIYEGEFETTPIKEETSKIDTLFFKEIKEKIVVSILESMIVILENYPYRLENSYYRFKKAVYSNKKIKINHDVIKNMGYRLVYINGWNAFLF